MRKAGNGQERFGNFIVTQTRLYAANVELRRPGIDIQGAVPLH